jgi:short-subunit dehydrogenase
MNTTRKQMDMQKRTVLISGATGGLGKAFAVECASRGWDLLLTDRNPATLERLGHALEEGYGVKVLRLSCDLTDAESRDKLYQQLRSGRERIDALINVAGVDHEGLFLEQSPSALTTIVRLNIEGTLDLSRNVLPLRDRSRQFLLINVASLAGFYAMPYKATYAASKRFLIDWSRALREELREENVNVTVLCPAGMPTHSECIRSIESQGIAGQLTTVDVGRVADVTLNAAYRGQLMVIPGWINNALRLAGRLMPAGLVSRAIGQRWQKTRERKEQNTVGAGELLKTT